MSKVTLPYVRNKVLWPLVSKFVRLSAADWKGYVACVTCGIVKHWKEMQAGHFNPGRTNSIIFDVRGIHPQCYQCNVGKKGNPREYDAYMRKTYGDEIVKELDQNRHKVEIFDMPQLLALVGEYRLKVKALLEEKDTIQ